MRLSICNIPSVITRGAASYPGPLTAVTTLIFIHLHVAPLALMDSPFPAKRLDLKAWKANEGGAQLADCYNESIQHFWHFKTSQRGLIMTVNNVEMLILMSCYSNLCVTFKIKRPACFQLVLRGGVKCRRADLLETPLKLTNSSTTGTFLFFNWQRRIVTLGVCLWCKIIAQSQDLKATLRADSFKFMMKLTWVSHKIT